MIYKTLVPKLEWLGKKMLNTATFSSIKKNCHWSRTEHCLFWALSQDDLVEREGGEEGGKEPTFGERMRKCFSGRLI